MNEINIDLKSPLDAYDGGYIGESNATKLVCDLGDLYQNDITFYTVRFVTALGEIVCSKRFFAADITNGKLELMLGYELTTTEKLTFCVECYKEQQSVVVMIKKSPMVCVCFKNSVNGFGKELSEKTESIFTELDTIVSESKDIHQDVKNMYDEFKTGIPVYSCDKYKLLAEKTVTENTNSITFDDLNINGRFLLFCHMVGADENTTSTALKISINDFSRSFSEVTSTVGQSTEVNLLVNGNCSPFLNCSIIKVNSLYSIPYDTSVESINSIKLSTFNISRYMGLGTYIRIYVVSPNYEQ